MASAVETRRAKGPVEVRSPHVVYRQIELVKPAVILAMGNTAAQSLLSTKQSLGALRNRIWDAIAEPDI